LQWRIAREHGWETIFDAEHLAFGTLQADALITIDRELALKAEGIVPLAPLAALSSEWSRAAPARAGATHSIIARQNAPVLCYRTGEVLEVSARSTYRMITVIGRCTALPGAPGPRGTLPLKHAVAQRQMTSTLTRTA
jgi:hypothetical protein